MRSPFHLFLIAAVGVGSPAIGQSQESIYAPCAQIDDDTARLACFDATYARESIIETERAEAKRQRTMDDFGLSGAQIAERERAEQEAQPVVPADNSSQLTKAAPAPTPPVEPDVEPDEIVATITEVLRDARNNHVLLLDNGQVWRATSASNYRGSVRAGWTVRISKGKIAGYRLRFDGRKGFLAVKRMR